jgi:hypothetical protein
MIGMNVGTPKEETITEVNNMTASAAPLITGGTSQGEDSNQASLVGAKLDTPTIRVFSCPQQKHALSRRG